MCLHMCWLNRGDGPGSDGSVHSEAALTAVSFTATREHCRLIFRVTKGTRAARTFSAAPPPLSPRAGVCGVGIIPPQQLDFEKEASSCFYTSPGLFLSSLTSTKNTTFICSETQQVITSSGLWDPYLWGRFCGVFFLLPSAPWYFLPLEGKKKIIKILAGLSPLSKSLLHMKAGKES